MIDRLLTAAACLPLVAGGAPVAAWVRAGAFARRPLARVVVAAVLTPIVVLGAPIGAWAMAEDLLAKGDGR